jgi:uncharacterized protein YndB with AHSA1/START domain
MSKRSAHHATFVIERPYAVSPPRVFAARAEPKAEAQWFVGPDAWEKSDHNLVRSIKELK